MEEGIMSSNQGDVTYNWKDITAEFSEAASHLKLGELLHDANFGLFEAMSAIEMMDPKMDAGMLCNQSKRKVLNLQQAIQAGTVNITDVTMSQLIAIIDTTYACMVTWLEGHSLAQTVFTNLYLHNPNIIEQRYLKAYCLCMIKTVDVIRERINRASVFEEEDFQPMTYGFKMAGDVSDMRVIGMVKEVEEELNRQIKNTRSKPGEERDATTEAEHELAVAVFSRLRYTRLLFSTLLAFSKEKCQGRGDAMKCLSQMQELMPSIKRTVQLGVQAVQDEDAQDYPLIMGFEPLVNQRLLPPTFPRYTKIKSREDAVEYLDTLTGRLKFVCQVPDIQSLHTLLEVFLEFSKPSPCVLSRSILQLLFLPQNRRIFGIHSVVDVLRDTVRTFICPPALQIKSVVGNNPQAKEYVDTFLTRAVRPLCNIFQITGHNRARQRDKWAHLLEDLANLQDEADKVDAYLHSLLIKLEPNRQHLGCFGTWVLYHTLQVMIHYTLAGFELELYATHEYHYVFWYLYECLYSWLISTLGRADSFLLEQESIADQQLKGRNNKKNKKKKKIHPHSREITETQAYQNLCGGFYKAVVGFTLDGKLKQPEFEFDSEEVRYNHRFAPFGNLMTPPPVQYGQFKEMTDMSRYEVPPAPQELYTAACKCFQQAKLLYESLPNQNEEVQCLIKIAKTNFVVMKLLVGGHKKDSKDPPEFDFSVHRLFPVIKLN